MLLSTWCIWSTYVPTYLRAYGAFTSCAFQLLLFCQVPLCFGTKETRVIITEDFVGFHQWNQKRVILLTEICSGSCKAMLTKIGGIRPNLSCEIREFGTNFWQAASYTKQTYFSTTRIKPDNNSKQRMKEDRRIAAKALDWTTAALKHKPNISCLTAWYVTQLCTEVSQIYSSHHISFLPHIIIHAL